MPARPEPLPGAGAVHVWRANLQEIDDGSTDLLSPDERARAARIVRERERRQWMRARGVLRALLGLYLERDPRALRFERGVHGKPALRPTLRDASTGLPADDGPTGTPRGSPTPVSQTLAFNLSHSGPLALYAFTAGIPVGVDVELLDRHPFDEPALARRVFGEAEARRLEALPLPARRREFLRAWVRHEAAIKCLGLGIAAVESTEEQRRPWIADLDVAGEGAAAVAVEGGPHDLQCWIWRCA